MKKTLKKIENKIYYYKEGKEIIINRKNKETYPSGIYGKISGIYGNISENLYGNISGIYGNISGIYGNINDCELTQEERCKKINIEDLIQQDI